MSDDTVGWRKLREFAAVDLTQSYVLAWSYAHGTLIIDVDLFLMPEHPFYEKPRPAEKVCIRPAKIEFPYCESLQLNGHERHSVAEATSELGIGAIHDLQRANDGPFEIRGEFGTVVIDAERPVLRLRGP